MQARDVTRYATSPVCFPWANSVHGPSPTSFRCAPELCTDHALCWRAVARTYVECASVRASGAIAPLAAHR